MTDEYAHLSTGELARRARALHAAREFPDYPIPPFLLAVLLRRNKDRRKDAADMEAEIQRRENAHKETMSNE